MKLASVHLGGSQWVVGELLRGLPPPVRRNEEDEEPEADPIVLGDAVIVVHLPIPIEAPSLAPGQPPIGLMGADSLIGAPLPAPLHIEYGESAPPWQHLEIDESNPPDGGIVRRYIALIRRMPPAPAPVDGGTPAARESKRTLRTS